MYMHSSSYPKFELLSCGGIYDFLPYFQKTHGVSFLHIIERAVDGCQRPVFPSQPADGLHLGYGNTIMQLPAGRNFYQIDGLASLIQLRNQDTLVNHPLRRDCRFPSGRHNGDRVFRRLCRQRKTHAAQEHCQCKYHSSNHLKAIESTART